MKKTLMLLMFVLLGVSLVACNKTKVDKDTYRMAFGEAKNLNSLTTIQASDSDVYEFIIGSFYSSDYDWDTAIAEGIATERGDFSKIRATAGDGKEHSIDELGYVRTLSDAAKFPYAVNEKRDATVDGVLNEDESKSLMDNVWEITLRDDLQFSNGTKINAETVEYSIKQYLSPTLLAERGNHIYDTDYLNLVNAREYYFQNTPYVEQVPKLDDEGEPVLDEEGNEILVDGDRVVPDVVEWDEVGFEVTGELSFKLTMNSDDSQWGVMSSLSVFNLVEPELFEEGYNSARTVTTYGGLDNIPPSYGAYVLTNWEQDQKFTFERNEDYHDKDSWPILKIDGPIIADQSARIDEFKAGNIDVAGVSGVFYPEYADNPGLYITPSNQFMRLDFSIERPNADDESLIMKDPDFRQALMLGMDREAFGQGPVAPAAPLVGYVSNIHRSDEDDPQFYNDTPQHRDLLEELELLENNGYNPVKAKELFNTAYDKLVSSGKLKAGEKASVEFAYYDVESNQNIAKWLKAHFEELFGTDKFEWKQTPRAQDAHTVATDAGDFDVAFAGLSGGNYMTVILFDMVYGETDPRYKFFNGVGFDLRGTKLQPTNLSNTKAFLEEKHETPLDTTAENYDDQLDTRVAEEAFLEALDANGIFNGTFMELTNLYTSLSAYNGDFEGRYDDLNNMIQSFEKVMFETAPSVPLFSSIGATVYSSRVELQAPAWNEKMGWGGLRYTNLK